MEIVSHSSCTKSLGAPEDMPEPDCASLPVTEVTDKWGTWSVSFWQPTPEELTILTQGGTVSLWVRAQDDAHPVVGVGAQPKE